MLFLAIRRVIVRNQEGKDMLAEWIRKFDIRNYNNQDVSKACLLVESVARAIGERELPSNTVRRVVTGMGHASNAEFKELCRTALVMLSNSFYCKTVTKLTITQHLTRTLDNLEAKYAELVTAKAWDRVGHEASAFLCLPTSEDSEPGQCFDNYLAAQDKLVYLGKTTLPFDEWVKTMDCHRCSKKGHISPQCPLCKQAPPDANGVGAA